MKQLTEEQLLNLETLYNNGKSPSEIAIELNLHPRSVDRILKKQGVFRHKLSRITSEQVHAIKTQYQNGDTAKQIATILDINLSTVYRIIKRENIAPAPQSTNKGITKTLQKHTDLTKYGTTYIPEYNGNLLTGKYVASLTAEEKEKAADFIFSFYRSNGFPYAQLTDDELYDDFSKLRQMDPNSVIKDGAITQHKADGVLIFKHFAPHFHEAKSGISSLPSMLEAFNDDKLLRRAIETRLEQNFNITGNMLRQGLKNSKVAYQVSTFFPTVAKYIYSKYTQADDIIFDYSMGYGQRLLGAMSLPYPITYVGVDPFEKSVESNKAIFDWLKDNVPHFKMQAELICSGSENYCDPKYHNRVKLAFSSPPYFNTEKYSSDPSQASHSGSYLYFINDWWKKTVQNIDKLLTEDGTLILNIGKMAGKYPIKDDMAETVKSIGYDLIEDIPFQISKNGAYKINKEQKFEHILIFKRAKSAQ